MIVRVSGRRLLLCTYKQAGQLSVVQREKPGWQLQKTTGIVSCLQECAYLFVMERQFLLEPLPSALIPGNC